LFHRWFRSCYKCALPPSVSITWRWLLLKREKFITHFYLSARHPSKVRSKETMIWGQAIYVGVTAVASFGGEHDPADGVGFPCDQRDDGYGISQADGGDDVTAGDGHV
jgi:hypothetical protein